MSNHQWIRFHTVDGQGSELWTEYNHVRDERPGVWVELWGSGPALVTEYIVTDSRHDGPVAGVLADWFEDNRENFPHQCLQAVDRTIRVLRFRFEDEDHNQPA